MKKNQTKQSTNQEISDIILCSCCCWFFFVLVHHNFLTHHRCSAVCYNYHIAVSSIVFESSLLLLLLLLPSSHVHRSFYFISFTNSHSTDFNLYSTSYELHFNYQVVYFCLALLGMKCTAYGFGAMKIEREIFRWYCWTRFGIAHHRAFDVFVYIERHYHCRHCTSWSFTIKREKNCIRCINGQKKYERAKEKKRKQQQQCDAFWNAIPTLFHHCILLYLPSFSLNHPFFLSIANTLHVYVICDASLHFNLIAV